MDRQFGTRAVVIGGSMAGLLAARVLSEKFAKVVILERDSLTSEQLIRKGTPQARHTHGLLAGGSRELARLFPGIEDELLRLGATSGDILGDCYWFVHGGMHVERQSGLIGSLQSRPLLEQVVRRRVVQLSNVELRDRVSVERLTTDMLGQRIIGLQLTDRRDYRAESLAADLVVDASGRASRTPSWLAGLCYPAPAEERIEIDLRYATQLFRRQPGDFQGKVAVIITQVPPNRRMGVALAVEGERWSLTLGGMQEDVPPADNDGFREFARGLPSPLIGEFLATAEPLSEVQLYQFPASIRRRYEHLKRFPEGLVVLGDAVCSFNPIYGQGMTVAAFEANLLGECLVGGQAGLARRFFARAAQLIDTPWQIAATADFQFPDVRGTRPRSAGLMNWYMKRLHYAAHHDAEVAFAFHRVANLLAPPSSLLRPAILWRVLKNSWRANPSAASAAAHTGRKASSQVYVGV